MHKLNQLLNQSRNSERTPLMSVLLEGPRGTGKVKFFLSLFFFLKFNFTKLHTFFSIDCYCS